METLLDPCSFKVHHSMCIKLLKLVDRISRIFLEIEKARPGCSSGIQALCSLQCASEKAKLLLQSCSESSKLYLAMTGDAIATRCQQSRKLFEQSLGQLQSMVSVMLAAEIARIIHDLRGAVFTLDSSEEMAGKIVRELLKNGASVSDSMENFEIEALRSAAVKLHITSRKALIIEKRSIKKLLDKVGDSDPKKGRILKYLLYLLKKYGEFISVKQTENACSWVEDSFAVKNSYNSSVNSKPVEEESHIGYEQHSAQTDVLSSAIPPEEFKCPISLRLMYDPVVIASGQTFERMWIQKWFDEGNVTCPKTELKLAHLSLTANTGMKDLIVKWCKEYGVTISNPSMPLEDLTFEDSSTSIASFGSSMNHIRFQNNLSNISLGSLDTSYNSDSSHPNITNGMNLRLRKAVENSHQFQSSTNMNGKDLDIISSLSQLQWEEQCAVVEDVRDHLKYSNEICDSLSCEDMFAHLLRFLADAHYQHDVRAHKAGFQLLLEFMRKSRSEIPNLHEDAFRLLASFFDSEVTDEALAIMDIFSGHRDFRCKVTASGGLAFILKILDPKFRDFQEPAIKILYNLSSNKKVCSLIVSLECISKLVPFLVDPAFTRYCILILRNFCDIEEGRAAIAETNGCIASIAELLSIGNREDQEHTISILLSLCSQRDKYCQLVMDEDLIPTLFDISLNGNNNGKTAARELLRLLRDINNSDAQESSGTDSNASRESDNPSKEKKPSSKVSGFFGRKLPKLSSLAPKKK